MDHLNHAIDAKQKDVKSTIEARPDDDALLNKETDGQLFIEKIDAFQDSLADVKDDEVRESLSKDLVTLLGKASSPEKIAELRTELQTALNNYETAINAYKKWKSGKYEVEKGDNLSKIVEKKLEIPWKTDPKLHFAILRKIQEQRTTIGSVPHINDQGVFEPKKGSDRADLLEPGEYLDLATAKQGATPNIEDIRWYASQEPKYSGPLTKVADQLEAEEKMVQEDAIKEDLGDERIANEELRATYVQELVSRNTANEAKSVAAKAAVLTEDFEDNFVFDPSTQGSTAYLEKVLAAANAVDMWDDRDKEKAVMGKAQQACEHNLNVMRALLNQAKPAEKETDAYKTLNSFYIEESKRFIELSANISEAFENSDARNIEASIRVANELLPRMSFDEATTWIFKISEEIDSNQFQSEALSLDYQRLFTVIKSALNAKLVRPNEPEAYEGYAKNCLLLANFFSGRSHDIDSALCDSAWAAKLAREASNSEKIMLDLLQKSGDLVAEQEDLVKVFNEEKSEALAWLDHQTDPAFDAAKAQLNAPVNSIEALGTAWALIFQIQHLKEGSPLPSEDELTKTVVNFLGHYVEGAQGQLESSFEGTGDPSTLLEGQGISLTGCQKDALSLLSDIEGYGWLNPSDKSWAYAQMAHKIATSIAIGVTVAVATGGLGLVAAAVIGGAAMTASSAVIYQKGYEDGVEGFVDAYGAEMAVNTTTMGASRYLAAGRAIYSLQRTGAIETVFVRNGRLATLSPEATQIMRLAGQRGGMKVIASLDDGMTMGNRLMGAGLEGVADTTIGAGLDTVLIGGNFLENFQNNAMFLGVGFGFEFGGPMMGRFVKGVEVASPESLGTLRSLNEEGSLLHAKIARFAKDQKMSPEDFLTHMQENTLPGHIDMDQASALFMEYQALQMNYKMTVDEVLKLSDQNTASVSNEAPLPEGPTRATHMKNRATELYSSAKTWLSGIKAKMDAWAKSPPESTQVIESFFGEWRTKMESHKNSLVFLWGHLPSIPDLNLRRRVEGLLKQANDLVMSSYKHLGELEFEATLNRELNSIARLTTLDESRLLSSDVTLARFRRELSAAPESDWSKRMLLQIDDARARVDAELRSRASTKTSTVETVPAAEPVPTIETPAPVKPPIETTRNRNLTPRRNPEKKAFDEVPRATDVAYVPDVHGDVQALQKSLERMKFVDSTGAWIGGTGRLVFSGDYIDRGSSSLEVLDYTLRLSQEAALAGGQVDLLIGNHEALMLGALMGRRADWANWASNGGMNVLDEVMAKQGFTTTKEAMDWLRDQFFKPEGRYHVLLKEWAPVAQIDDVLYVHAGVSRAWANILQSQGVDGVNQLWQTAIAEAQAGETVLFEQFTSVGAARQGNAAEGGLFWMDFRRETLALNAAGVAEITSALKSLGINAIVVGHSQIDSPQVAANFAQHGVMVIASDVGMSAYYREDGTPGEGGVTINTSGHIDSNNNGATLNLYTTPPKAKAGVVAVAVAEPTPEPPSLPKEAELVELPPLHTPKGHPDAEHLSSASFGPYYTESHSNVLEGMRSAWSRHLADHRYARSSRSEPDAVERLSPSETERALQGLGTAKSELDHLSYSVPNSSKEQGRVLSQLSNLTNAFGLDGFREEIFRLERTLSESVNNGSDNPFHGLFNDPFEEVPLDTYELRSLIDRMNQEAKSHIDDLSSHRDGLLAIDQLSQARENVLRDLSAHLYSLSSEYGEVQSDLRRHQSVLNIGDFTDLDSLTSETSYILTSLEDMDPSIEATARLAYLREAARKVLSPGLQESFDGRLDGAALHLETSTPESALDVEEALGDLRLDLMHALTEQRTLLEETSKETLRLKALDEEMKAAQEFRDELSNEDLRAAA